MFRIGTRLLRYFGCALGGLSSAGLGHAASSAFFQGPCSFLLASENELENPQTVVEFYRQFLQFYRGQMDEEAFLAELDRMFLKKSYYELSSSRPESGLIRSTLKSLGESHYGKNSEVLAGVQEYIATLRLELRGSAERIEESVRRTRRNTVLREYPFSVSDTRISENGTRVLKKVGRTIVLVHLDESVPPRTYPAPEEYFSFQASPDFKHVLLKKLHSHDHPHHWLDLETGVWTPLELPVGFGYGPSHGNGPEATVDWKNQRIFFSGSNGSVIWENPAARNPPQLLPGISEVMDQASIDPARKYAFAASRRSLDFWDLTRATQIGALPLKTFPLKTYGKFQVDWASRRVLISNELTHARLLKWEINAFGEAIFREIGKFELGRYTRDLVSLPTALILANWAQGKALLVGAEEGWCRLLDLNTGLEVKVFQLGGDGRPFERLVVSTSLDRLSGVMGSDLIVWDIVKNSLVIKIPGFKTTPSHLPQSDFLLIERKSGGSVVIDLRRIGEEAEFY